MKNLYTYTTALLLTLTLFTNAQQPSWRWGQIMGTDINHPTINTWREKTQVVEDKHGNYYVLGSTLKFTLLDSTVYYNYGTSSYAFGFYLAKFDCDGNLQWEKMMGEKSNDGNPGGTFLHYDEVHDGVFVQVPFSGIFYTSYIGIGNSVGNYSQYDTAFIPPNNPPSQEFLIAFNGDGSIRWMRPDAPNGSTKGPAFKKMITVPGDGIYAYVLAGGVPAVPPGVILGNDTLTSLCTYWVKFDFDLNYQWSKLVSSPGSTVQYYGQSFQPLDIAISPDRNAYMVGQLGGGQDSMIIGNTLYVNDTVLDSYNAMVVKIDLDGNLKWVQRTEDTMQHYFNGVTVTKHNRIYVGGFLSRASSHNYGGYQFTNYTNGTGQPNVLLEIDTNGNLVQGINADYRYFETFSRIKSDHEGNLYYYAEFVNDSTVLGGHVWHRHGSPYGVNIIKLNEDLEPLSQIELKSYQPGAIDYNMEPVELQVDERGNLLTSGNFRQGFIVDSVGTFYNHGGLYDNFIAQYGYDCSSNEALIAPVDPDSLIATGISQHAADVTWADNAQYETGFYIYRSNNQNGPYTLIDSVSANTTTYTNTGLNAGTVYWYQAAAYNHAGISEYTNADSAQTMDTVIIGITQVSPDVAVQIVPNPFAGQASIISGADAIGSMVEVYDLTGRRIKSIRIEGSRTPITSEGMNSGSYYYKVVNSHGETQCRGTFITN